MHAHEVTDRGLQLVLPDPAFDPVRSEQAVYHLQELGSADYTAAPDNRQQNKRGELDEEQ